MHYLRKRTEKAKPLANSRRIPEISRSPQLSPAAVDLCTVQQGKYPTSAILCAIVCLLSHMQHHPAKGKMQNRLDPVLFPRQKGAPVHNEYGIYGARLRFNGCDRLVDLDDCMECDAEGALCGSHAECRDEFWVPLVERAVAKIYGEGLGSVETTPSLEVFHLAGW